MSFQKRVGTEALQSEYIRKLAAAVEKHLTIPHRFICFADDLSKVPSGIEAQLLNAPLLKRGLPKAYVYGAPFTGCPIKHGTPILLFDLDMLVVGDFSDFFAHKEELVCRERYYKLPKIIPDGDLVFSAAGSNKAKACADQFFTESETDGQLTDGGDERLILDRAGARCWGEICPGRLVSYKKHCRQNGHPPKGAAIVSFHGDPLQENVHEPWVEENWHNL